MAGFQSFSHVAGFLCAAYLFPMHGAPASCIIGRMCESLCVSPMTDWERLQGASRLGTLG